MAQHTIELVKLSALTQIQADLEAATAADRIATTADRAQTGLDRAQTGADRVQTGADRVTATSAASAAGASASNASAASVAASAQRSAVDAALATVAGETASVVAHQADANAHPNLRAAVDAAIGTAVGAHVGIYHAVTPGIGLAGQQGFGVGVYPGALPAGYSALSGSSDPGSDNYGNYQYSDGSIMCWIAKFYYRIGNASSPRFAVYGANAIDIADASAFTDTLAANASGYALHRAFIDGGAEKAGFFVDKYQCSNNAGVASSLKNGAPLSTAAAHNPIASLTGNGKTVANLYGACIVAAKTRGDDFHCISRFQWAALALLASAHGQAATAATYCAWYDATGVKNYPKGNNNNALKDVDDTTVAWESDGYPNCGKTGSAGYGGGAGNLFAKSTHNGQNCGVADLNGNMWEVNIGMTCIAATKTITGATQANPCEITIPAHGYSNGDVVMITAVGGMTQLNDKLYVITATGDNTVTLNGVDSTGYSAFTAGGSATKGAFYAAKQATAMKDFTSGNALATDHWGAAGVAAMMEPVALEFFTMSGSNGVGQRYGNGPAQVLEGGVSGDAWVRAGLGLPGAGGASSAGSNLFGADYFYQYVRNELCLLSGGDWTNSSLAGVWALALNGHRANSYDTVGLRASAYV